MLFRTVGGTSLSGDSASGRIGSLKTVCAGAVFLLASAYMFRRTMLTIASPGSNAGGTLADFRDAIYVPLKALKEGVNPYDTPRYLAQYPEAAQEFPLYSPHLLALFSPFTLVSLNSARLLHLLLTFCLFPVFIAQLSRLATRKMSCALVLSLSAVAVLSLPGRYIVGTGQTTLLLAIGLALVLSPSTSTILAAFGVCLLLTKLVIGLPILIFLLCLGRTRSVLWGILISAVLTLPVLSRLIVVSAGHDGLIGAFRANLAFRSTLNLSRTDLFVDPISVIARVRGADVPSALQFGWVTVVVGTIAVLLLTMPKCLERERLPGLATVLISSAVLVSFYQPTYHLIFLGTAAASLVGILCNERSTRGTRGDRMLRPYVLVLLLLIGGLFFNPVLNETVIERFGAPRNILLRSSNGIGVLLLFVLTLGLPIAGADGVRHRWSFANRKSDSCSRCVRSNAPVPTRLSRLLDRRREQDSLVSRPALGSSSKRTSSMFRLEKS